MFSLTGWKIGWVCGPRSLIEVITKAHQFNTFTTSPALQLGVVEGLRHHMDFAIANSQALEGRRDQIACALREAGFDVLRSEGTYFITASIRNISNEPDVAFCQRITREAGVAAIPVSVFYSADPPRDLVRFAFCKTSTLIEQAGSRLARYFGSPAP
jgi:aspartate/methionine/tyrosine aminotransferase